VLGKMDNEINTFIEKIFQLPHSITDDEYLVIPMAQLEKVLTPSRIKIIDMLFSQNPLTEEKLSSLFRYDTHKDLIFLRHLRLVNIQKIDNEQKHDIITLNRKIRVV
jgi:hypothetical protein